jgi:hypothetical protein
MNVLGNEPNDQCFLNFSEARWMFVRSMLCLCIKMDVFF